MSSSAEISAVIVVPSRRFTGRPCVSRDCARLLILEVRGCIRINASAGRRGILIRSEVEFDPAPAGEVSGCLQVKPEGGVDQLLEVGLGRVDTRKL